MRPFAPTRRAPAALLAVLAAAVGACSPEADAPPAITADAPVFSKADAPAPDAADHACRVVLRDLGRSDNGMGGYVTQGGSWVWTGHLDVAATDIANGARPAVLFRANGVGDWYEVAATATTGGTAQRPRYQVQLADHTAPLPSASGTSIASSRMEVVPFLHLADGSRLFDHNRNLDDLSNYLLNVSDGFSVNDDPAVCGGPGWMGNVVVNLGAAR